MKFLLPMVLLCVGGMPLLAGGRIAACAEPGASAAREEDQVPTVKIVLRPAAEPRPALKYQLLPGVLDRKAGNAAVMYTKIALMLAERPRPEKFEGSEWDKISKWLEMPLAELPRQEVAATLSGFRQVLDELGLAARRQRCPWEEPLEERNLITLPLPELSKMRDCGRLLALQARLQIAEGKHAEALRTLQTGYAFGRHAAEAPILISGLVGVAICQMMSQQVQELIQQPGAPNLYWALTSLPRPLIDFCPAAETEMNFLYLSFPALRSVDDRSRGPAYWQHFIDEMGESLAVMFGQPPKVGWRAAFAVLAVKAYPMARQDLIQQGRSPQEVDAMPVAQVVALHTLRTYNELRDETFKWFYVPYWQAQAGASRAEEKLLAEARQREVVPLASMLLPAVGRVQAVAARNDRSIAALRTLEALRIYAAGHDGRLPEKLSEVIEVPLPVDPMTGQPFRYQRSAQIGILESPVPQGLSPGQYALRWEIQVMR